MVRDCFKIFPLINFAYSRDLQHNMYNFSIYQKLGKLNDRGRIDIELTESVVANFEKVIHLKMC